MPTECPNCGSRTPPAEVVVGGIRYYNCVRCDFSTWARDEYKTTAKQEETR